MKVESADPFAGVVGAARGPRAAQRPKPTLDQLFRSGDPQDTAQARQWLVSCKQTGDRRAVCELAGTVDDELLTSDRPADVRTDLYLAAVAAACDQALDDFEPHRRRLLRFCRLPSGDGALPDCPGARERLEELCDRELRRGADRGARTSEPEWWFAVASEAYVRMLAEFAGRRRHRLTSAMRRRLRAQLRGGGASPIRNAAALNHLYPDSIWRNAYLHALRGVRATDVPPVRELRRRLTVGVALSFDDLCNSKGWG